MKNVHRCRKYRRAVCLLLFSTLLITLLVTPAHANDQRQQKLGVWQDGTLVNGTVYLGTATLQPIFQSQINQRVPGIVNGALTDMVSKLPQSDQGWAYQMATTLVQPSVTLSQLRPQQGGLAATMNLSLYPGDPHPVAASVLVSFSVLNASTVQVSAQPVNGSPALVNGPVTTFQVPFGQLNSITSTPSCGASALALGLRFPMTLGLAPQQGAGALADIKEEALQRAPRASVSAYVEISAPALTSLGSGIGTLSISSGLTAQNIQVAVQRSQLVITADILWNSLKIGTATTYVQPTVSNGSLAVDILKTNLTVLQIITFPYNTYNQQIEQKLNTRLNNALASKFNVSSAAIGPNSQAPCVASNSLLISGTTSIG